jgi:SAM-dependent methyltransferase
MTEILMTLGYKVFALDPAAAMHRVAKRRLELAAAHWRVPQPLAVEHLCQPMEECSLPDESVDAVIFSESLHHVVREEVALAQAFRVLRPGGTLAVTEEGAWIPGDQNLESSIEQAMAEYGTLENPFTQEYLDYLLVHVGFEPPVRYIGVSGYFPLDQGGRPIADVAQLPVIGTNDLTAVKPTPFSTADPRVQASAAIAVGSATIDVHRVARVECVVTNTGEATLLSLRSGVESGLVTVCLCKTTETGMIEAGRVPLTESLPPRRSVFLTLTLPLPAGQSADGWCLTLVNEGHYWFHDRGVRPVPVVFG